MADARQLMTCACSEHDFRKVGRERDDARDGVRQMNRTAEIVLDDAIRIARRGAPWNAECTAC